MVTLAFVARSSVRGRLPGWRPIAGEVGTSRPSRRGVSIPGDRVGTGAHPGVGPCGRGCGRASARDIRGRRPGRGPDRRRRRSRRARAERSVRPGAVRRAGPRGPAWERRGRCRPGTTGHGGSRSFAAGVAAVAPRLGQLAPRPAPERSSRAPRREGRPAPISHTADEPRPLRCRGAPGAGRGTDRLNVPAGTGTRAGGVPGDERDELCDQVDLVDEVLAGELLALVVEILAGQLEQFERGEGRRRENWQRKKKEPGHPSSPAPCRSRGRRGRGLASARRRAPECEEDFRRALPQKPGAGRGPDDRRSHRLAATPRPASSSPLIFPPSPRRATPAAEVLTARGSAGGKPGAPTCPLFGTGPLLRSSTRRRRLRSPRRYVHRRRARRFAPGPSVALPRSRSPRPPRPSGCCEPSSCPTPSRGRGSPLRPGARRQPLQQTASSVRESGENASPRPASAPSRAPVAIRGLALIFDAPQLNGVFAPR